jgi:hypothetical protein
MTAEEAAVPPVTDPITELTLEMRTVRKPARLTLHASGYSDIDWYYTSEVARIELLPNHGEPIQDETREG